MGVGLLVLGGGDAAAGFDGVEGSLGLERKALPCVVLNDMASAAAALLSIFTKS